MIVNTVPEYIIHIIIDKIHYYNALSQIAAIHNT